MCYTPEMSFGFVLLGFVGLWYVKDTKKRFLSLLIVFYMLMELLQTVQAYLVNDCDNPWNPLLTEVAYLFVLVQPLLWNFYFYNNSTTESGLFKAGIGLAIGWMVFDLAGRLLHGTMRNRTEEDSILIGDRVCTYKGSSHLYWKWTSANLGSMTATHSMYLLIWFVPALLSVGFRSTALIIMAGALASAGITAYMGDVKGFTAAWCFISIPLVALIIGLEK